MPKVGFQTRCDLHIVGPDVRETDVEMVIVGDTDGIVNFTIYSSAGKGAEEIFSAAMNDVYFTDMAVTPSKKGLGKKTYSLLVQVMNPSNDPEDPYITVLEEERELLLDFSFSSETEAYRTQKSLFDTQDAVHSTMQQALFDAILRECKAAGKLNFKEFAQDNIKTERVINRNHEITVPMMVGHVETIVSDFVNENKLDGWVDKEKDTYVDKGLAGTAQKAVHVNIQMDFSPLLEALGNKGIAVTSIECPKCGNPATLPKEGSMFSCPACGSTIKVTDVYEMFKKLIE